MKEVKTRFMRVMLFFDLPSVSRKDHREYSKFVKLLKSKGFIMMQESVYTKLALNPTVATSCINEIRNQLPPDGCVSVLTITENQFASIEHMLGEIHTDVIANEEKVIKL